MVHARMRAASGRKALTRRLLRVALVCIVAWLLLSNALLNAGLVEPLVNRKPERFTLHWGRALMLWPGYIIVWDVNMRGQVRANAWQIRAPRVSGRVALWPLLGKELRFTRIDGVSPQISVNHVDYDLPAAPVRENAWRLGFDDVRVNSALRFSLDDAVLSGVAEARAAWSQQLRGGTFELSPSTLRLSDARLERGEQVLIEALSVNAEGQIDSHLRREHRGLAMLDFLALDLSLDGRGPGFSLVMDEQLDVVHSLLPGRGDVRGRIVLDRGQVGDHTRMSIRLPIEVATHAGHQLSDDAQLVLQTDGDDLAVDLTLPSLPDLVESAEARLRLSSRALPLPPWDDQWQRLGGVIDLHARFASLDLVQHLLVRLHGFRLDGQGDVRGHVVLKEGQLAFGTEVTVSDAAFGIEAWSHRFHGSANANARFVPQAEGAPAAVAQVTLARFDIASLAQPDAILGSGRNLILDLRSNGTLAQLRDRVRARLHFFAATLPDLTRFNRYLPANGVRFLSGTGHIDADMSMDVAENRNGGSFTVSATAAAMRIGDIVLRGDLLVDAKLVAESLADRQFRLPGTKVSIRNASIVEPTDERVEGWWAVADVSNGYMSFEQPMDLAADADVLMRDVAPLLSIFARHKAMPRWVRRLIDDGEATVVGRLQRREECLLLDQIEANNDRFEVRARLRLCEGQPDGQLYARWGVLGMGVELAHGERKFHLIGAKKWFESQPGWLSER